MTKWSDRTTYQSKRVNQGTLAIIKAANTILQESPYYGKESSDMTLVQGGYNAGGVSASAGTHDGGGAFDFSAFNAKNRVKVLRLLGTATWDRPTISGLWSRHVHGIVSGDGTASSGAKGQVSEYYRGGDGLVGSRKDPDWRPVVPQILFVAPWDARGKAGKRYATKQYTMRSEPTNKSSSRGSVSKGDVFTVVAVVNAKGTLWAINVHGNFLPASVLTTKAPSTAPAKPKPAPVVTTPTAKSFKANIGTLNVIRWRLRPDGKDFTTPYGLRITDVQKGKLYEDRLAGLARIRSKLNASILGTQESGQYDDADAFTKKMGSNWANVLHGDNAGDITNAIQFYKARRTLLTEGKFTTAGTTHNVATWAILKDKRTGVVFMTVSDHLEHRARGTSKASKYDLLREQQADALIAKATVIAKKYRVTYKVADIPIVFVGDFNSDKDDAYDGPGRAFVSAGYIDVQNAAKAVNGPATTVNGMSKTKTSGRRLDRVFVKRGTLVERLYTVGGYPSTDHNGVVAQGIHLDNKV